MSIITQAESTNTVGPVPGTPVPDNTNQQQLASSGVEVLNKLFEQQTQLSKAIAQAVPGALAPQRQSGQAGASIPGTFNPNFQQPQFAPAQGHKDARNQGVAKIVSGAMSVVSSFVKAKDEEKKRVLSTDIQRVLGAQDGISQAQQALQNPDATPEQKKQAQALIDKNKTIINDTIGSDPRKMKQFEKAFDINFVNPADNNKPEHAAMKDAVKSYADQLAAKTPDKMGPNQAAINKVQALQAQQQAVNADIQRVMPQVIQEQKQQAAKELEEQKEQARQDLQNQKIQYDAAKTEAELKSRHDTVIQAAKIAGNTRLQAAAISAEGAYKRTMDALDKRDQMIKDKELRGKDAEKTLQGSLKLAQDQYDKLDQQILNEQSIMSSSKGGWFKKGDTATYDAAKAQLDYLNQQKQIYGQRISEYNDKLAKLGELPDGGNTGTNTKSTGSSITSTGSEQKSNSTAETGKPEIKIGSDNDDSDDDSDPDDF